jgi:hypothetical protein
MSKSLGNVEPALAAGVERAVSTLPDTIGLTSLRALAWPMAQLLADGARLNLMSLEALAAARDLDAEICLAEVDVDQQLVDAARARGVEVRFVDS